MIKLMKLRIYRYYYNKINSIKYLINKSLKSSYNDKTIAENKTILENQKRINT